MFVETYRQENSGSIMAGGDAKPVPYPKISQEDWRAWTLFLPVRSATIDRVRAGTDEIHCISPMAFRTP